ncbi:MAG: hypothetical protein WC974_09620 [Thermoplasmata archaeon]
MNIVTDGLSFLQPTANYVWSTSLLAWDEMEQPIISGGTIVVGSVNQGTGGASAWLITASSLPLPTGAATQTTLADVLAKIITSPATEAKQDTLIAKDFATQTTLALIKAKTDNLDVALSTRTKSTDTQIVSSKVALTASVPASGSVGTSSAELVATNSNRKSLIIKNISINTISLGLGQTAILNAGLTLAPYEVWTMNEYTFVTGAINAIASDVTSAVSIQEFN